VVQGKKHRASERNVRLKKGERAVVSISSYRGGERVDQKIGQGRKCGPGRRRFTSLNQRKGERCGQSLQRNEEERKAEPFYFSKEREYIHDSTNSRGGVRIPR